MKSELLGRPALRRPRKHQPCPAYFGVAHHGFTSHFRTQPTKNPGSLVGFGVMVVAVALNPARPYSLPEASVSKESVTRERRFIEKSGLAGILAHAPAHTLAPTGREVKIAAYTDI